jgi:hypothetical protein
MTCLIVRFDVDHASESTIYGTSVYYVTSILEGDNISTNSLYYNAYYVVEKTYLLLVLQRFQIDIFNYRIYK